MTEKIGLAPGSAIYTGDMEQKHPLISLTSYNKNSFEIKDFQNIDTLNTHTTEITDNSNLWIHIEPISDAQSISTLGSLFNLHPLIIEDILSVKHRPKAEEFDDYIFVIMKYPEYKEGILSFSQISFILKENRLLSFAEKSPERFLAIIKRLEKKDSKIKKENIQYLLLSLLDYLVDYNFLILEKISDEIEDLEDEIINNASKESIAHVHNLKRTLMEIKKNIWPMREVLNTLINSDTIEQKYHIYYRDVYENIINIIDIIEGNRDTVSSFIDIYLSSLSNRMNEIMKTLSIISTIFIPLSFLTGYFGMNFKYQTVLESENIYNWSNALMILIPIILLAYFKLRKWF